MMVTMHEPYLVFDSSFFTVLPLKRISHFVLALLLPTLGETLIEYAPVLLALYFFLKEPLVNFFDLTS